MAVQKAVDTLVLPKTWLPRPESARGKDGVYAILAALVVGAAALLYGHAVGRAGLGASEAYSALAAAQGRATSVAQVALLLDPGKPPLYHLLLHGFTAWFGTGEGALRMFSVGFGIASVWLAYALGSELFGVEVGIGAAFLWAFDPIAVVEARWARMYSMFVALAMLHLWAMRRKGRTEKVVLGGLSGAVMLYTHLCALLVIAGDIIVTVREWRENGYSDSWPAIAIALALFLPFCPIAISQASSLLFGHWLDWIGIGHESLNFRIVAGMAGAGVLLWLTFAPRTVDERSAAFHWCLIYGVTPVVALATVSIAVRPSFCVRYVSPGVCILTIGLVHLLDRAGERARNLGIVGLGTLLLAMVPSYYGPRREPWAAIAAEIESNRNRAEPVFFEAGFLSSARDIVGQGNNGFPLGFFRVPFDYYFHGSNPRAVIPGSDPAAGQRIIAAAVAEMGGAWLVSAKPRADALREIPRSAPVTVDIERAFPEILLFHLKAEQQTGHGVIGR